MGYKGTIRSIGAAVRTAERNAKRRQRELEKQAKEIQKMEELERASFEVSKYENELEVLTTLHNDMSGCNMSLLENLVEPIEPTYHKTKELKARQVLSDYKPGIFDKVFGTGDKKVSKLESKIELATEQDKHTFDLSMDRWRTEKKEFSYFDKLLSDINSYDRSAVQTWIELSKPFEELESLGTKVHIDCIGKRLVAEITSNPIEIIPEVTKSLLKSGKLSEKKTTISKRNEQYQDYIASESLKISRELFAMLPYEELIINSNVKILNKATGYHERSTVLSVFYVRETIEHINYESIDPSDAITNFVHNMNFKKTRGFEKVDQIEIT
ncbi:MAG: hypothetical protein JEZ08_01875 [Clostridiales bacterium]|nr:hypothetical protein [Clostridiales bacterium]